MKPLHQFNNADKARLLHQLFPAEIPALLKFIKGMCATIKEGRLEIRSRWDNEFITFDLWLEVLSEVEKAIGKYGTRLHKSSSLFSDQLFDGYAALFTTYCIITYTTVRQHKDGKFVKVVDLLFNP